MDSVPDAALQPLIAKTAGPQPGRRLFHAANGLVVWAILEHTTVPEPLLAATLGALFLLLLTADLLRLRIPALNRHFFQLFRHLASPREGKGIASSTWFAAGLALSILLLPRPFAAGGILVLSLADPVANWFGRRYGVRTFGTGTRLGSTLFYGVSFGVLLPIGGTIPALLAAAITTLAEAARWKVDDNLLIPLCAGGALWLLSGLPL